MGLSLLECYKEKYENKLRQVLEKYNNEISISYKKQPWIYFKIYVDKQEIRIQHLGVHSLSKEIDVDFENCKVLNWMLSNNEKGQYRIENIINEKWIKNKI